jgi:hypothetical protein
MERGDSMKLNRISNQRGLSLIGLLLVGGILAFLFFIGLRVTPTVTEYFEIKRAVERSARDAATPGDIRSAFDKNKNVGYIDSLSSADLEINRDKDGRFEVSFSYEKRIPLGGPVYLLIEYQGSAKGSTR